MTEQATSKQLYQAGEFLFRENDGGRELYYMLRGAVQVLKNDEVIATIDTPGSYIGEISALLDVPRSASVQTIMPSEFIVVSRFEALAESDVGLAMRLARDLAGRLNRMNDQVTNLIARLRQLESGIEGEHGVLTMALDQWSPATVWQKGLDEVNGDSD